MKRILILGIFILLLGGCAEEDVPRGPATLSGVVTDVWSSGITVDVNSLGSISLSLDEDDAEFFVGNNVTIYFSGAVMTSDPPQLVGVTDVVLAE